MLAIKNYISFGKVEDDTFFVNKKINKALVLHKEGTLIWNYIYKGDKKEVIISKLVSVYGENYETKISKSIDDLIEKLKEYDIL